MREIAADGRGLAHAHVADIAEGRGDDGKSLAHQWRQLDHPVSRQSANPNAVAFLSDVTQPRDRLQIDQIRIVQRPLLQQDDQRRAAADGAGIVAMPLQQLHGLGQRSRLKKIE